MNHRRITDGIPPDAPLFLKWLLVAIKEVGVITVAFFCMLYITFVSMKNMTTSLEKQSQDLETLILTVNLNHDETKSFRNQMLSNIQDIRDRIVQKR